MNADIEAIFLFSSWLRGLFRPRAAVGSHGGGIRQDAAPWNFPSPAAAGFGQWQWRPVHLSILRAQRQQQQQEEAAIPSVAARVSTCDRPWAVSGASPQLVEQGLEF